MARSKSKTDQVRITAQRLLEDDELQKHLRVAGIRLTDAWSRANGRPVSKAAQDKKLYKQVREAAASLVAASARLERKPSPAKRHAPKVVAVAALAGGAAYAVAKKRSNGAAATTAAATNTPTPAPTPPLAAV